MKKILLLLLLLISVSGYSQAGSIPLTKEPEKVVMPVFPGGFDRMVTFISVNVKYPEDAIKNKITGTVLVEFTLSTTGKVEDVTVIKSLYPSCDAEAVRIVSLMPDWSPAEYKGKKVRIIQKIPISFKF